MPQSLLYIFTVGSSGELPEQSFPQLQTLLLCSTNGRGMEQALSLVIKIIPFLSLSLSLPLSVKMYGMIHLLDLPQVFSKLELATLLTASICHDIDHPGFNNKSVICASVSEKGKRERMAKNSQCICSIHCYMTVVLCVLSSFPHPF